MSKAVKVSELKANLAKYLRMVRHGQEVEILDRGIPIAKILSIAPKMELTIRSALKPPSELAKLKSKVSAAPAGFDVVDFLLEDRRKR